MKNIITLTLLALPFIAMAQLQNLSFEQWENNPENAFHIKPLAWVITDGFFEGNYCYYPPETASQSGDYALKLGVWYTYTKDAAKQTAPINSRPSALTGYYKYTENLVYKHPEFAVDAAQVSIYLTKWNESLSQNDTIGSGKIDLGESLNYSSFSCPVTYTSEEIPDHVSVYLDCSKVARNPGGYICPNNTGSYFTVDNLELQEITMGIGDLTAGKVRVYPNPAVNKVTIANFSGDAELYDMTGKLVLTQRNTENNTIDVQQLQKGIYTLKLAEGNTIQYSKLIKD